MAPPLLQPPKDWSKISKAQEDAQLSKLTAQLPRPVMQSKSESSMSISVARRGQATEPHVSVGKGSLAIGRAARR